MSSETFTFEEANHLPYILSSYLESARAEGRIHIAEDAFEYWREVHGPLAELYVAAIHVLRQAPPRPVTPPPIGTIESGTLLYTVQPDQREGCALRTIDWFVLDEKDTQRKIEFHSIKHGANIIVCTYRTNRQLPLIGLDFTYTYFDFEKYLSQKDPAYTPSFTDYGEGDNNVAADYIERNSVQMGAVGWHEAPGALPIPHPFTEVMIVHGDQFLTLIDQKSIEVKKRRF